METKKDYLNRIYHLAVIAGLCTQKREFAELLEVNRSGLSSAMSGDEKNLTDSLIRKVKAFAREHGLEGGAPAPAVQPEPEVQREPAQVLRPSFRPVPERELPPVLRPATARTAARPPFRRGLPLPCAALRRACCFPG